MSALSRYLLKEHAWPFVLGFLLIVFVLLIDVALQFMDRMLSKGLAIAMALQLLLFNLAWIIALAVPMAVLIAVLMAFARLAADGEILAAKACGIGFFSLLRPVLLVAAILSFLMIIFNDSVLPDWNHRARTISSSLQRTKAALVLKQKEGIFVRALGGYNLLIRQVDEETNTLSGITLYDVLRPGPPVALHAQMGQLQLFENGSYARLNLENGYYHRIEYDDRERSLLGRFTSQVLHIKDPRRAFERRQSTYRSDREMDIASMREHVQKKRAEQEEARRDLDTTIQEMLTILKQSDPTDSAVTNSFDQLALIREKVRKSVRLIDSRQTQIDEFQVEIHKKFSIPAACMIFALLGAPLGAIIRRRGAAVSVGTSIAFFWIYWMFLIGGEELADRGFIDPALAMWSPNIAFLCIGLFLVYGVTYDHSWKNRLLKKG